MEKLPGEPLQEPLQMELLAASLRADSTDNKAFLEALATKLAGSLPNQTTVIRQSSIFSREHPVKEITVTMGDYQYRIGREKQGPILTQRAKVVRGIVLKTEQIPMDQWIDELADALAHEAANSAQARIALERFLLQ
ncbi:MAG: hypothetical protein E6I80_23220 [Chloroflexi bacterium]|nr:MAG: hypothetical protein E6I80_23220 [Chloroflexota bacterium]